MATKRVTSIREWRRFLSKCLSEPLSERLDVQKFKMFVPLQYADHPLPPTFIADIFLQPRPNNHYSIDPRVPLYLQILLQLKYVDTPSILRALYKYSTSHAQSSSDAGATDAEAAPGRNMLRWGSSYGHEETTFYGITPAVAQGTGIKSTREAIDTVKVMAKWMTLFTAASSAFATEIMDALQPSVSLAQTQMEYARAAFVMLLLGVCENQVVLNALSRPLAKGTLAATLTRSLPPSLAVLVAS